MGYNIISGDSHIDVKFLPGDVFVSGAPARLKGLMPQIVETKDGPRWYSEGTDLATRLPNANMDFFPRGWSARIDRMHDQGFFDGRPHPTTPELRLKDQDVDGIDAEIIYGILHLNNHIESPEILTLCYQLYNSWAAEFSKTNPERFFCLACVPNDDPHAAAEEVRRVAELGLRGAEFAVSTAAKPLWHRDWDPLWAAAGECNIPISFHTTGVEVRKPSDDQMAKEYNDPYRATWLTLFQLAGAEFLTSIIYSGATERYPEFKFVLGECGASWIPYILARMDEEYEDRYRHLNFSLKPSGYWYRQGYTTFQHEPTIGDLIHLVGEDNVLWGSDYPHSDGVWPDSQKMIEDDMGQMDEKVRRKLTRDNAGKLYGILN